MADTRKLMELTVDDYRKEFFPSGVDGFSGGGNVVKPTPPPVTPGQQVRLYKWACELIGIADQNERARYAPDEEITSTWRAESANNASDEQRKKFFPKW